MATVYEVKVGLDVLARAGLGVDVVTAEHRALVPHPIQATGSVANWLAGMPANVYADVLDAAHRRAGGTEFVLAERAVAVLILLLVGDYRPLRLTQLRPYDAAFGELAVSIKHYYANAAVEACAARPSVLLDHVHDAARLINKHQLPLADTIGHGLILTRLGEAIRSALVFGCAHHGVEDTAELLSSAVDQAQW